MPGPSPTSSPRDLVFNSGRTAFAGDPVAAPSLVFCAAVGPGWQRERSLSASQCCGYLRAEDGFSHAILPPYLVNRPIATQPVGNRLAMAGATAWARGVRVRAVSTYCPAERQCKRLRHVRVDTKVKIPMRHDGYRSKWRCATTLIWRRLWGSMGSLSSSGVDISLGRCGLTLSGMA